MIYFKTRAKAREFANMFKGCKVHDMQNNPSLNSSRWAVKVKG